MKIYSINSISYQSSTPAKVHANKNYHSNVKYQQPSFQGKHSSAKFWGGLFGTLGTLGAIGGTIIMTGGVALPAVLAYGAMSAGSGAILGHIIDKGAEKADKKEKENNK